MDPADGLLVQGGPDLPLTWMDAKVGNLVVTPRLGKAVEINAVWYNALPLMEEWTRSGGNEGRAHYYSSLAERVRTSFNLRFWNEGTSALFDVVDGDAGNDDAIRPNQLFAISLAHPVLNARRWKAVVDVVHNQLLTPYGLRSLAPGHPDYNQILR